LGLTSNGDKCRRGGGGGGGGLCFFHKTRDWNDGNFVFPIISTPNKLKKYFSCSYNLLLLGPQVWKIGKFGILKKTICRQLGKLTLLRNVCSISI
jgi:hypothetical protein